MRSGWTLKRAAAGAGGTGSTVRIGLLHAMAGASASALLASSVRAISTGALHSLAPRPVVFVPHRTLATAGAAMSRFINTAKLAAAQNAGNSGSASAIAAAAAAAKPIRPRRVSGRATARLAAARIPHEQMEGANKQSAPLSVDDELVASEEFDESDDRPTRTKWDVMPHFEDTSPSQRPQSQSRAEALVYGSAGTDPRRKSATEKKLLRAAQSSGESTAPDPDLESDAFSDADEMVEPAPASSQRLDRFAVKEWRAKQRQLENVAAARERTDPYSIKNPANWKVAILGRPNVGKSSLFNRLVGRSTAIVDKQPGVTRDRCEGEGSIASLEFTVVDTAGLEETQTYLRTRDTPPAQLVSNRPLDISLQASILEQTERAIAEADVVLFLVDARAGVTPIDHHFAQWLRKRSTKRIAVRDDSTGELKEQIVSIPVVLVANKAEHQGRGVEAGQLECFELGFGAPVPVSAEHAEGFADLYEAVNTAMQKLIPVKTRLLAEKKQRETGSLAAAATTSDGKHSDGRQNTIKFAFCGKPNVGKSTLLNALVGAQRVVTGPQPGITRDSVSVDWRDPNHPEQSFVLIDTAGLKGVSSMARSRWSKIDSDAMEASLASIRLAHVVGLIVDPTDGLMERMQEANPNFATKPYTSHHDLELWKTKIERVLTKHDLDIARYVLAQGRALVILLNKWDSVKKPARHGVLTAFRATLEHLLPQAKSVPVLTISGQHLLGLEQLAPAVMRVHTRWSQHLPTAKLNRWLARYVALKPHPDNKGRSVKIKFIAQTGERPPTFQLTVNRAKLVAENYLKMIATALTHEFDLDGVPVRVHVHSPPNPYATRSGGHRKLSPVEINSRRKAQHRRERRPGYARSKTKHLSK